MCDEQCSSFYYFLDPWFDCVHILSVFGFIACMMRFESIRFSNIRSLRPSRCLEGLPLEDLLRCLTSSMYFSSVLLELFLLRYSRLVLAAGCVFSLLQV